MICTLVFQLKNVSILMDIYCESCVCVCVYQFILHFLKSHSMNSVTMYFNVWALNQLDKGDRKGLSLYLNLL